METMDDYVEAEVLDPAVVINAAPSTRLTDTDHKRLRSAAKLPLGVFITAIIAYAVGIININLVPVITTIILILTAVTVLSAVLLLYLVFKARKQRAVKLTEYAVRTIPLMEQKYGIQDLTPDLLTALINHITLSLYVKDRIQRVKFMNIGDSGVLLTRNTDTPTKD